MFDVLISTIIEMPFTGRGKAFYVLKYAQSQSNKTVQQFAKSNADLDMTQRGRLFVQEKRIWIELTCALSQLERILNMCEINYEIYISLNFSFKLVGIILILYYEFL